MAFRRRSFRSPAGRARCKRSWSFLSSSPRTASSARSALIFELLGEGDPLGFVIAVVVGFGQHFGDGFAAEFFARSLDLGFLHGASLLLPCRVQAAINELLNSSSMQK